MQVEPIAVRRAVLGIVVLLIVVVVIVIVVEKTGLFDELQRIVEGAGVWAPLVYIGLKALTFVVAPLSGVSLKISGGVLFGLRDGTVYTLVGDLIGGSINFWLARSLGRTVVSRLVGQKRMERVDTFSYQIGGWRALLFARVFLSAVYDFVSYAAGLTQLRFRDYLIVSVTGGLVSTVFWTAFGASLTKDPVVFVLVSVALAGLFLVSVVLRNRILGSLLNDSESSMNEEPDSSSEDSNNHGREGLEP